jgi:hypothetical protein
MASGVLLVASVRLGLLPRTASDEPYTLLYLSEWTRVPGAPCSTTSSFLSPWTSQTSRPACPTPPTAARRSWVVHAPEEDAYHLFFVAGAKTTPRDSRGIVGCARSTDLIYWENLGVVTTSSIAGDPRAPRVAPA